MKSNKVLEEMAKLIAKHGMHRLKPRLIEALKRVYGVEGLYFWKDSSGWAYCTEWDPKKPHGLWADHNRELMDFDELARCLHSLDKNTNKMGGYIIVYEGQRHSDLEEIKKDVLIRKLAGIK